MGREGLSHARLLDRCCRLQVASSVCTAVIVPVIKDDCNCLAVFIDLGMGQTAHRHAVSSGVPAWAGLGSLWAACCERRLVVGRTLRARAHDVFHNVIAECSGFRMLGGRCEHVGG